MKEIIMRDLQYNNLCITKPTNGIRDACSELHLTDAQIKELMEKLLDNIKRGLGKATHEEAIVKCFITYVQDLPNGKETGKFLALDLGGTNFRVLLIQLKPEQFDMQSKIYAIPQQIMIGTGEQLFDHIAECLANFMTEFKVDKERLPLGFTFSFPLKQLGLTKGILERWTKGFNCSGVIGEDVVHLLKEAIRRRNDIEITVMAILNDSTGTVMSCAHINRQCRIGIIIGTGSNACYVEKMENAEMYEGDTHGKSHVLINTEWGAFGDDGCLEFIRTEFDKEIDENSINPGKQLHEKMISGMYMGEVARLAIVKYIKKGLLFGGKGSDLIYQRGSFFTKYISEIENDPKGSFIMCKQILEELGLSHATDQDCANIRYICHSVSRRAAYLVSAGVATLANKINEPEITVGVDGSVYRFHPYFQIIMKEKINQIVNPGIKVNLMLSEDGSGRGAALVAAVVCRES